MCVYIYIYICIYLNSQKSARREPVFPAPPPLLYRSAQWELDLLSMQRMQRARQTPSLRRARPRRGDGSRAQPECPQSPPDKHPLPFGRDNFATLSPEALKP